MLRIILSVVDRSMALHRNKRQRFFFLDDGDSLIRRCPYRPLLLE